MLGIVGAFLGGFIFRALHLRIPFSGVASTIFVAFVGAVVLLLLMRLVGRVSGRGRRSAAIAALIATLTLALSNRASADEPEPLAQVVV